MSTGISVVRERIARTNGQLLAATGDLAELSFSRRHGPRAPSVRFHLFHVSRSSDQIQSWLAESSPTIGEKLGRRPQLWIAQEIAKAWGMADIELGNSGIGAGMSDDDAASLPLPPRDVVTAYAKAAFAEIEHALGELEPDDFDLAARDFMVRDVPRWTSVGGALVHHLIHINRHLGMIEALRGVLGVRGTATQ